MQLRTVLVVAGAAGPQDVANGVFQRFGFAPATLAHGVPEALALVARQRFDLAVLPLQSMGPMELAAFERETRKHGTLVIGSSAQTDSELILRAMRSGVHEFLAYPPPPLELTSAVDRLMRRTRSGAANGSVIAVYSAKGGLGTTAVAVNVAFALAHAHSDGRVALVDLVPTTGDVRLMLNLKPQYDIGELAAKAERLDAELLLSVMTPAQNGVWVLPASEEPEAADALDAQVTGTILEQLRAAFPYTVVDCEHHLSERTITTLDAADRVALVTQLDVASLRAAQRSLALFQRLGYADEKVHVVANRVGSGEGISLADAAHVLGRPVSGHLPNDWRASSTALSKGIAVTESAAKSPLAAGYDALAARLNGGAVAGATDRNRIRKFLSFGRK